MKSISVHQKCTKTHLQQCAGPKKIFACGGLSSERSGNVFTTTTPLATMDVVIIVKPFMAVTSVWFLSTNAWTSQSIHVGSNRTWVPVARGLRPSVLGQDRSVTIKIGFGLGLARCGLGLVHCGLGLAGMVLCCERKTILSRSSIVIMILNDTATFQVLFVVFSILYLEHHYCGDQQWCSLIVKS